MKTKDNNIQKTCVVCGVPVDDDESSLTENEQAFYNGIVCSDECFVLLRDAVAAGRTIVPGLCMCGKKMYEDEGLKDLGDEDTGHQYVHRACWKAHDPFSIGTKDENQVSPFEL